MPRTRLPLMLALCLLSLPAHARSKAILPPPAAATPTADDPNQWLEEVTGEKPLAWVKAHNAVSEKLLQARPEYAPIRAELLAILNSRAKIPYVSRMGAQFYNLWQDADHKRGLWRRTTLDQYKLAEPQWETVIDVDALGAAEKETWVWGGADCLAPEYRRCMVSLSRGGADAKVIREFDTQTKSFVAGGFAIPEAKTDLEWQDADTLLIGSDFGPGSLTDSGYPRVIKRWKRGTPLASATVVFEGKATDVAAWATVSLAKGAERTLVGRSPSFFSTEVFWLDRDKLVAIPKPADAVLQADRQWLTLRLRSDWAVAGRTYKSGSLLIAPFADVVAGKQEFSVLFEPTATTSLSGAAMLRSHIVVNVLDNVANRLEEWTFAAGKWAKRAVVAPALGTLGVGALHDPTLGQDPLGDSYLLNYSDFVTPDALMLGTAGSDARSTLKQRPSQFDAAGIVAKQFFAKSKDGTAVPYFVVTPKGTKPGTPLPTALYGYGGFEVSLKPSYAAHYGAAWLTRGGVYVVANIRGGGEFGPRWHQAALQHNRQRAYDDFAAVAEDLIARKVTTPKQLGMLGGSNGGLLVGAVAMQRPELFGAVVCSVPLLDMKRFHKLLAGASWMAEYGNPDKPEDWAVLQTFSPYHNVSKDKRYPKILFTTSTRDDRVHPGHARKMVAKMEQLGHQVLYYENTEGGHGGAADNEQRAHLLALEFAYLWQQLGTPHAK